MVTESKISAKEQEASSYTPEEAQQAHWLEKIANLTRFSSRAATANLLGIDLSVLYKIEKGRKINGAVGAHLDTLSHFSHFDLEARFRRSMQVTRTPSTKREGA